MAAWLARDILQLVPSIAHSDKNNPCLSRAKPQIVSAVNTRLWIKDDAVVRSGRQSIGAIHFGNVNNAAVKYFWLGHDALSVSLLRRVEESHCREKFRL